MQGAERCHPVCAPSMSRKMALVLRHACVSFRAAGSPRHPASPIEGNLIRPNNSRSFEFVGFPIRLHRVRGRSSCWCDYCGSMDRDRCDGSTVPEASVPGDGEDLWSASKPGSRTIDSEQLPGRRGDMRLIHRPDTPSGERRRHSREPCECRGRLMHGSGEHPCTVVDISPGGARVRVDRTLETQMPVRLKMTQAGEFTGEVAWISTDSMGIRFAHRPLA